VTAVKHSESEASPTLTALMPVKAYHERFLHEAVDSLLAQTNPDWRLLVIVENSDRTELEQVLLRHLADPRIEVIVNEGRKLAGKFNTGMRQARSEFVATLLGDDLWSSDAVAVLSKSIGAHPDVDFFHSSRRYIDEGGRQISSIYQSRPNVTIEDFGPWACPVKHLLCWRRESGLAIGGMDESLDDAGGVDDFDFPWSMAQGGALFKAIPDCLYIYRDHRECFRLTTHLPKNRRKREIARILRKHGVRSSSIVSQVAEAERGYLRQCLYRSRIDRWVKRVIRSDPRAGWREPYR
jgi:glycosyltransferase involved in cell wall biosynthesis